MTFLINFFKNIFYTRNNKILSTCQKIIKNINNLEESIKSLSLEQIIEKTKDLKKKKNIGVKLEIILQEAFAIAREVSKRLLGMRHYDVQLMGGICLFYNKIIEMQTGEGKTLVAVLPAYMNFICANKVHIVTVNDYLAKRDTLWMSPVYNALGMEVGLITTECEIHVRKQQYKADVVYGTNNEFCFDYLRNNMVFSSEELIQNELTYAIIDEIDSVLIDEARTPLIIATSYQEHIQNYIIINDIVKVFFRKNSTQLNIYINIDMKSKTINLTEEGYKYFENVLKNTNLLKEKETLYTENNIWLVYHIQIAIKAHLLIKKNVDYIVTDNNIIIIDENTGRIMHGRRWSGGIHQAVEAKENVKIQQESKTLASITFQNYFRLYSNLAGMTGTAKTEEKEFNFVYNLEVVEIPTNKKCIRYDYPDVIFLTKEEKYANIIVNVETHLKNLRPILIGTTSIDTSELLAKFFKEKGINHNILNAKLHEKEALIIADAGKISNVTIATNMAGRGTDIVLGGKKSFDINWEKNFNIVKNAGGLHVIGTERHEARRIDNQLRGRAGRQGDPGSSQFYLAIQDNLIKIFLSEKLTALFSKLWIKKNDPIEHKWITKLIENSQKKIEGYYSDVRKQLLEYDDILNEQRVIFFKERMEIVKKKKVIDFSYLCIENIVKRINNKYQTQNSFEELILHIKKIYNIKFEKNIENIEELYTIILKEFKNNYLKIIEKFKEENDFFQLEKKILLSILDFNWQYHLDNIEHLKETCYLHSYAQKDPKQEYKKEIFMLFSQMIQKIQEDFISFLFNLHLK